MSRSIFFTLIVFASFFLINRIEAQSVDNSSIEDKVICGYQGWFNAYGDGSPVDRWVHWSRGIYQSNSGAPSPGEVTFEVYPDVTDYSDADLYQTGLGTLGDGRPAKLYSSYHQEVLQKHFQWMEQNGIDGVALQRFIAETYDGVFEANRDTVAVRLMRAAEERHRIFYIMYDISGFNGDQLSYLENDWSSTLVNGLHLTSSPAYAQNDGKPVVALWGIGFTHIQFTAAQSLELINWFKTNGYYVIAGTPTYWRQGINDSKPDFEEVYQALDMISPWTVGRYANTAEADNYRDNLLIPDRDYCSFHSIAYQPVLFPGFAWSNWNGGPVNEMPRVFGRLFWRQAYNIRESEIPAAYIAMFDEYDEGTAIAPGADSYLSVPNDQYFLTTSADGKYLSSDFYVRLAGEITRMIESDIPSDSIFSTSYSSNPVYFRTSLEPGYDALPDWSNTVDETTILTNVSGDGPGNIPECTVNTERSHTGSSAVRLKGIDNSASASYCYYKVFNVNIPVESDTYLHFWTYPENENGRHISIDLVMSDGSNLRDAGAEDTDGNSMHPGAGRGTINQWMETNCKIGDWLQGKTIDRILVAYDLGPETGEFSAFIDDIQIMNVESEPPVSHSELPNDESVYFSVYPNPSDKDMLTIHFALKDQTGIRLLTICDSGGRIQYQQEVESKSDIIIPVTDWNKGLYIVTLRNENSIMSQKILHY
jgi:hypothetical protein